jgi:hypothetical protein
MSAPSACTFARGVLRSRAPRGHRSARMYDMIYHVYSANVDQLHMITASQLRAARALAAMDQRALATASGLSLPTIQRMEASEGVIRGNVDSLMKLIAALDAAGVELIAEGAVSDRGGRGVRLRHADATS